MSDIWGTGQAASGAAQAAAMIVAAGLQYKAAHEQLTLQREIWRTQKKWAGQYHDLWYNKYRPVEESFLKYMSGKKPYAPQYATVESRAVVGVRREFALAREKARRCIDPRCVGLRGATERQLAIEEAKAAVTMINRGYRAEEARKDTKDAQWEQSMFSLMQLGRGLTTNALGALQGAAQTAALASNIDPYSGFAKAAGEIAAEWRSNQARNAVNNDLKNSSSNKYYEGFDNNASGSAFAAALKNS